MRERTPSADDTPKRAPPAPSREAVVAGSETSSDDTIEAYHTAKLHGISSVSGATSSADRMVASMQSLEDLAVNHPANVTGSNGDRQQQQQERYGHAYRSSAQTAQDKRSRLSNVINNLRKKVPDGTVKGNAESPRKEEDDRNSVERNLETLEKYVMTVLNGVIKDDEEEDKGKSAEKMKETERRRKDSEEEENPTGTTVKSEPSNESDIEAAVVPCLEDSSIVENAESSKIISCLTKGVIEESVEVSEVKISQDSKELSTRTEEEHVDVEKEKSSESDRDISREKKENQTLGTIIMDRLSEHQVEERANVDDGRGRDQRDECVVSENVEVQAICIELLDEVLNDVYLTIDNQKSQREECEKMKELIDTTESKIEEIKDSNINPTQELKSLHCSLPLDKIAFVLQNCQISESMTSVTSRLSSGSSSNSSSAQKSKSSSCTTPPVRLLCLYCDRKFLSISLQQRHTERVHQLAGGRRSERNFRKPSQNCQYCSEKCVGTLETLFQHMISNHGDKYHACVQCLTRYPTREALMGHMNEMHGGNAERTTGQTPPEKIKEGSSCKEFCNRDMIKVSSVKERRSEEKELETSQGDSRQSDSTRSKLIVTRDSIDNPVSPEFDSSFYSNVSCNIRENLLHHLDGKLQTIGGGSPSCAPSVTVSGTTTTSTESKSQQQQQSYYEHSVNQIQFPIDISLTAATPVYSKDYSTGEEYENSSEYARKAGKTSSSSRPRRVSFEKYNFPRKYDGKEQWTCSIEDLSKFDISTQLSLRKKQQLIKERLTINRLHQTLLSCETTEVSLRDQEQVESIVETTTSSQNNVDESYNVDAASAALDVVRCDLGEPPPSEKETTTEESSSTSSPYLTKSFSTTTEFTIEFIDFMRLKRREPSSNETANVEKISYAELSGEWSRTRIYICGACGSKHMTLKEMEDHKASTHPRVLCSHFELTGDQREHYKHLYLPGQSAPTDEARDAMLAETVCTKCTKTCLNVAELHRHMLECGGDHAWLLGLTGSGKRKCKWRPFGSRSRRRRQRGMKRNIQNSQTQPRIINTERSKEKQAPAGPRVRPSDRESIQKMLANLPAKRATRKVLQDNVMRSQSKLRNVQTRTRRRIIGDNSSVSRISRNKAALRNKLLKNAKSIQRKRCRSDNITAVIESVVKNYHETEKKLDDDDSKNAEAENESKKDAKEINEVFLASKVSDSEDKPVRSKVIGRPKIFGRKGNIKTKTGNNSQFQCKAGDKLVNLKARGKSVKFKSNAISKSDAKGEETSSPKNIPKNSKMMPRTVDKNNTSPDSKRISTAPGIRGKSKLTQSTLKRKRPVDPVASLNASLKAKLQLRTQDGKFARNPNKNSSTKSEMKMGDGKHKAANSVEIKLLKSKTIQKLKKDEVQLPRRTTRLSSDSDKMPTLEPVMQIVSSNEEYTDKSTNDLPILSPVTSSGSLQDQKTPRTFAKYVLKEKESNTEINTDCEVIPEKSTKEQKPTRGRKPKQESKDTMKRKEIEIVEEDEISKNNTMMLKGRKIKNKKNVYNKNTNNGENNKEGTSKGEIIAKKDLKPRKEETTKKTRTNWKRFRRSFSEKDSMKLATFPFEVQKLLNSISSFSGILDTLELESNDTDSKHNLRQWLGRTPRSKVDLRDHMTDEMKKWKRQCKRLGIETIKKSSRKNVGKKTGKMMKTINLEKDSINNTITKDTTNNVEKSQPSKKDNHANTKIKEINNPDIEDKIDSRQTRRSLIDAKSEPPEIAGSSSQKGSGLFGKRRSRNKSIDDPEEINARAMQKQNNDENVMPKEVQKEEELEEAIDKNEIEGDDNSNSDRDSAMVNLSLNHLQSETSNLSVDSGKENSLETSVNIHNKLKVTRPKKTWGARRERSSRKRSLNNVIGILTEGINIPVEQSVQVLTVQTSLDNPDRVARNGSTQQSVGSENNMIAVDSAFSELSVLARNEQESAENKVISTNANDNQHADNEKNTHPCIDKAQDENNFTDQIDISSKVSTVKISPTNDIILDLSRRKPKVKGSFLEKIVSKIAKQKDALLEGEVGSLLDNAADELTSILNEVGPALADNAESANFGEVSYTTKNENESITSTSTDKKLPVIVTSEIQLLQDDITNIKSATSNHSTDLLVIQDNLEGNLTTKIEMQAQSKNQTKINDVSDVEIKDNYIIDKQASDTMRSIEELQVEFCENKSATNEKAIIPMEIPDETPSSLTDTLTEISISSITTQKLSVEKLEKKTSGIKSRRKSSKRSLEDASWPKKSKRKSLEIDQELAEKNIQKDWFDDVIVTNSKQKEMFNVGHELAEKVDETIKISKIDAEVEKLQCSESKIIKDLELSSSLEKILAEDEESNLEKLANLPEAAYEEANELTTSFKEGVDKIISNGESNDRSIELIEEGIESSTLSLKKNVKSGKFTDKTRKKNQKVDDASEFSHRRTSKRKSQLLSDVLQPSMKPVNEEKKLLPSSPKGDSLEFTDEKLMKVGTTNENSDVSLEETVYSVQITSEKCEGIQNADDSSLVNSTSSETTKKHGTKKKSLADEHLDLPKEPGKITSKFNKEINVPDSNEQLSVDLDHFKVPEVKDLLQSGKKRGPKKKLPPEDDHYNGESVSEESRINEELAEVSEMSNLIEKVEEQVECKKHIVREQSSRKKLERSSSSSSIGFIPSLVKTRSMFKKKTQLSSEDLAVSNTRNQDAESTDDLSESSCASESSYFRKKRFAKRKRKEENLVGDNDEQADSIIVKCNKGNSKKPQNAKSLLDEHLDLSDVDDIEIPMDIQASLENTKALENIEREFELAEKSLALQNEDADDKPMADESANKDITAEQSVSNNYDSPDDPVTPKKRAAGNFVVVHTKTGEILIVEKRKKLTKEAARFFCDVCATSFTRKSSLKKHTLSQSHLSQMAKSTKDKLELVNNDTSENNKEIDDKEKSNQVSERDTKNVLDDAQSHEVTQKSLESDENYVSYRTSTESLANIGVTRQEALEDKLLDEEICKITENMSHDEYVLTDQVTPEDPVSSSTPIKQIQKKQEELGGKNDDKKRNKSKKRNLAEEHLILESPELKGSKFDSNEPLNSVNDLEWSSSSSSCEHNSTKEMIQIVKEAKDVPEEIQHADSAEIKNQAESIVKSLNDEISCSKLSCDTDVKNEHHIESKETRTTRSRTNIGRTRELLALQSTAYPVDDVENDSIRDKKTSTRKFYKIDNDRKEENQTSTEITRFSLRPRRNKNIQHYEESDVEADIYFMNVCMELNNDEIENSCDPQKKPNEMEEEMIENVLQERTYPDIKNKDMEAPKSKPDSTNDIKKRKRGRPRLKDRIIPNSSVTLAHSEFEINENDIATSSFEESKSKNQELISHTKDNFDEASKAPYIDANIQPSKRRGRPRKNPVQVENNLLIQVENSSISESMKSKCNELRENTEQIESEMLLIEKTTSVTLTDSLTSNVESLPVVEDYIRESNLSETKRDELKVEENEILFTKMNSSENQSVQEIESTNIKIADTVLAQNCDMLAFNVPSEKNKATDTSILSEMKICADDEKYQSENKSDHNDTSANVLINSTVEALAEFSPEIIENVSTINDDVQSVKSIRAIELDESFEIQKPSIISEEEQIKSREELSEMEIFQKETKLVSESEGNEDEVIDDKSLPITNVGLIDLLQSTTYPIDDLENDSIRDKKTTRLESSSKKLSRSLQSANKERETSRRKSKVSRGRRKKVTAAKIAEISSDSENEVDRIESASSNKSKIVKSVFGRVFGGEKADKVKEVLNDWVSRSEDDSDISRSTSEARSCLRGSTKISENGHKKDKKRHSGILTDPDTKKDAELSPRKNGNDKGIIEVHGKLKNRKKREKDFNSMPEDRIESLSPINPAKRRHRESKIRADERIFRTFDDESLILSESEGNVNEIKETNNQFDDDYMNNKNDESKRYYEEEWNEERMKDRNSISVDCENLQVDHNTYGKSKNSSSYRKKQDTNAKNERSSSPSQFNMFKCRRRESKIKAGEKIWYTLDNETSSCLSDDQDLNETHKSFKERESGFHEFRDADRSNNSKNVKHKDNDTWKNISLINQEQIEAQNARGKSRKDSNNHKKQNFNTIGIGKTKADNMISKNSDNDLLIALKNQKTKNEVQNDQATRSTDESINRSKNLIVTDNTCEFFADMNHQLTNSRKSKRGTVNEDWKCSMKSLEFEKEDLAKDQPIEKEIRQKHEVSTTLSRSCSNLAGLTMKDQFAELEENSQAIRESDNDDNNDEEEEQEDDDDDNDLGRRRMSPFYACETPDSSIESSSNNEEDEEEEGEEDEEDEEERMTHEDTSRKTNPSEFSGEKIVIRSPSSGHRSDVVTIAPTDAIEDNALDVPREIESTTEPRQGKILNFDEELFVECCSRLKATSENELRGAKKIKLDHTESYHRRDDQPQGFKVNKDRWRDVESQNSLGSLLESVNQLLGEEMCNSHDRSYRTRGSEQSSRSASPDTSRVDNLGYEDSLDVAFEHNNKLRDKIQQRMRESENLIASTFGQKINDNDHPGDNDHKRCSIGNSYSSSIHEHEQSTSIASNRERVPSPGHKNKVNSTLGLLDKALSNLLHSNSKHDHNGSAPMKLLAELACARAPTSTSPEDTTNNGKNHQSVKMVAVAVAAAAAAAATATKDTSDLSKKPTKGSAITSKTSLTKKTRNPIKELFERKKEINDRKEQERSKTTLVELSMQKPRKPKRSKKQQQQEFPLIRRNELYGGMMEKKKRHDSFDRKGESERIKDVYEFDEEESQTAPTLGSVLSYRSQVDKSYETNWPKKDLDGKLSTASENGKTNYIADTKLGVIIDHKFQELEKFAPKTKGALKSFQSEEQQQQRVTDSITGPMDDFVERKQQRLKRLEQSVKQSNKLKKRGKSSKKRARNAWYENDSSDEFRTAAKAEDVGVGISKSQRACSKGKQNLFAELSTSSESEYEREDDVDYGIAKEQQSLSKSRKSLKKLLDIDNMNYDQHVINESKFDNENLANCDWQTQVVQKDATKKDYNAAKSESEMSDRSLVIDERKATDETRNSDDDADNQYERTFELEDLYREDSSELETEVEGNEELTPTTEEVKDKVETQALDDENATLQTKIPTNVKDDYAPENELIPLEEALDLLDRHILESRSENDSKHSKIQIENDSINGTLDTMNEVSNDGTINMEKENEHLNHTEAQDEKEELDDDVPALPEKLSSNEKPQKESDNNLPLHVFLSRKVQESKKRKQQQLDKLREEQERILMDFQPTRRQRKCAIGKQGLLAEISSSDEESYARDNNKKGSDHDKSRKKRESKEKKKERYLEKKHEQMIAKEQKAIEEEILREVGKRKEICAQSTDVDTALNIDVVETKIASGQAHKKKHQPKEKQKKSGDENIEKSMQHTINQSPLDSSEDIRNNLHAFCSTENIIENNGHLSISSKRKKLSKSPTRLKKISRSGENGKISPNKKNKESTAEKSKKTSASNSKDSKERRSSGGKHDSDDEELKTTKSWNKVEEGVGVAIGRRKRTAAHQLYYWSSSSDEEDAPELVLVPEEEEDDRQEQHGWIVGDSHKRMITMLAMEKQQKEKRRRSEDEFESGKSKSKKHRNSTS